MMKGIRGLLEKDFRLFLRQGGNLFLVLAVVAIFFHTHGKNWELTSLQCIFHLLWQYIQVIRSVTMKMVMDTHICFLYP